MIQIFTSRLILLLVWCPIMFAAEANLHETKHYILIGHPGVGKSAIINALVGRNVLASGLSLRGLTTHLQKIEHDGSLFIDTPGLADIEIQEQAALEIEKALKFNGIYKIFFVINVKEGRIVEKDCDTINRVLKAIDNAEKRFHIIINKIDELEREAIFNDRNECEEFYRLLKSKLLLKPLSILEIDLDGEMRSSDRDIIRLKDGERQSILNATGFYLSPNQVGRVLTEAAELRELQEQEAAKKRRLKEQKRERESLLWSGERSYGPCPLS